MIRVVKYRGWVKTIYVVYIVSLDICGLNALFRYTIQVFKFMEIKGCQLRTKQGIG